MHFSDTKKKMRKVQPPSLEPDAFLDLQKIDKLALLHHCPFLQQQPVIYTHEE